MYKPLTFQEEFQKYGTHMNVVGLEGKSMRITQSQDISESTEADFSAATDSSHPSNSEFGSLVEEVAAKFDEVNRREDFISFLKVIANGTLSTTNIAIQLALDVAKYADLSDKTTMRYGAISKDVWLLVYKLFKPAATRFFRGPRNDTEGPIDASEINFSVPAESNLRRYFSEFQMDTQKTGIIHKPLEKISESLTGPAKITMDGKKLAIGFDGQSGDENLNGHEEPPVLYERQQLFQGQLDNIRHVQQHADKVMNQCTTDIIDHSDKVILADGLKEVIHVLSMHVKALRETIVKKNYAVKKLMAKAGIDWLNSKYSNSISFHKYKIVPCEKNIKSLLRRIDDCGFYTCVLNKTDHLYVRGIDKEINVSDLSNFRCLTEVGNLTNLPVKQAAKHTKQGTDAWFDMRKRACFTGSTAFQAFGCSTLREQKEHHEKIYKGKEIIFSEATKEAMTYGSENEINGLATLACKLLPVYFGDLIYKEDGCEVVDIGDQGAMTVISPDGSLVSENSFSDCEVSVEVKCPTPGKEFTTQTTYC